MKLIDAIMKVIRTRTETSDRNCRQIESALKQDIPSAVEAFELWTIPEIKEEALQFTKQPISNELADDISEALYSDLRNSKAFTPEYVDDLIIKSFDERFSHISIAPVDNGEPPNIVSAAIADRFIAVGIIAEDHPPKNQGDPELITDMGRDQNAAKQFAKFLTESTGHLVTIHGQDLDQEAGMEP